MATKAATTEAATTHAGAEATPHSEDGARAPGPVVLCVLDGWGLRDETADNAVALGATPNFDRIWASGPRTTLSASGADVGLPKGQMGNSEVGHTNLGAGRVVLMDLPKIDAAIGDASFSRRPALTAFIAKAEGGAAHVLGLMSEGGVHAHQRHLVAVTRALARAGLTVKLHVFLDGRDTPPTSALGDLDRLEAALSDLPTVAIATVTGRFFALDRDNRWERVAQAYAAIAEGRGAADPQPTARAAIEAAYARGESDEFALATTIGGYAGVAPGDSLFATHFRADRMREILSALLEPDFDGFDRGERPPAFRAALGMTAYSDALDRRMAALFPQEPIVNGLGDWVARLGVAQFRAAETEKYPHVTFFFNGGVETPTEGEERFMAPSPKVATYDLAPEMAAGEVTEALTNAILSRRYGLIVVNYANPDMVGHTGDLKAAIRAVEAVDAGLGRAIEAVERAGGAMLATADHGNCELMRDPETGAPHTAHTTNPVPLMLIDARPGAPRLGLEPDGRLADVAPTLLALMGAPQPAEMTGRSLLKAL